MSFALSTYARRLEQTQAAMRERGIDYVLITPSSDLIYLLGYPAHTSERLTALMVPAQAGQRPFVVVPQLEAPRLAAVNDLITVMAWGETVDPVRLLAQALEIQAPTIAISDQMWSIFLLRLLAALPTARFVPASHVLDDLRQIKAADEIAALREAGRRTDDVWRAFCATTQFTGRSETQLGRQLAGLMVENSLGDPTFMIVASGPHSASPHHLTGERIVQRGDAIIFDFGGQIDGYKSDMTRTLHVGEPTAEFRTVYALVEAARQAALAAVRPTATCASIDAAARAVIVAGGYGEYFMHRVGHGLGLDIHEEPYLVSGNDKPLAAGMVFSDEPGIYLPGQFGVRIEDTVLCTESGGDLLNNAPRDLLVVE